MKKLILILPFALAACADPELRDHLEAERDFHAHQMYIESIYTKYDPEYIDDCLYYEDLVCEFE
jgi:hypothetical protein